MTARAENTKAAIARIESARDALYSVSVNDPIRPQLVAAVNSAIADAEPFIADMSDEEYEAVFAEILSEQS